MRLQHWNDVTSWLATTPKDWRLSETLSLNPKSKSAIQLACLLTWSPFVDRPLVWCKELLQSKSKQLWDFWNIRLKSDTICSKISVNFLVTLLPMNFELLQQWSGNVCRRSTVLIQLIMHSCFIYCSFVSTYKLDPSLIDIFTARSI